MSWFERMKAERDSKRDVIEALNYRIKVASKVTDPDVESMVKYADMKRKIKMNGVEVSDAVKVIGNIAVVAVIVGFEMSHIMSQKGSRFIKTL